MSYVACIHGKVRGMTRHGVWLSLAAVWSLLLVPASVFAQGPIPEPIQKGNIQIDLQLVADDLVSPIQLMDSGDGSGRLFVADQAGEVRLIKNGLLQSTPYLDVSNMLVPLGGIIEPHQDPFRDFDERGLLGLAFHPDFSISGANGFGKFYTYTSEPVGPAADFSVPMPPGESFDHQAVIREWTVDPSADTVQGAGSREIMRIDEPQFNHNGGTIAFGPDGNLYIPLGDGGAARDDAPGHGPNGNGQDATNVLGTILRIDPLGNNSTNGQYGIPVDNPFVTSAEVDEVYAFGLRNPFRISFDSMGRLIVADVGQNNIEEVDIVNSGDNLGWRYKEGSFYYDHVNNTVSETPIDGITPPGFTAVDPVLEYDHDEGTSIIGGFVYEGTEIPELIGKYVFGDFSRGFFNPDGRLFYGDLATGEIRELILGPRNANNTLGLYVKGFGVDADGELYLLGGTNLGPFRDADGIGYGSIWKITSFVPEPGASVVLAGLLTATLMRRRKALDE